jgi:L-lysine exporter family protein LysE/ArgO
MEIDIFTSIFFKGFFLGASLIMAIGLQNAFVLRQGIKKHHVFVTAFTASLIDVVLIGAGVLGFGALIEAFPSLITYITWGGVAFLVVYGIKSMFRAFKPEKMDEKYAKGMIKEGSSREIVLIILAISLLNPHVYLDTVVLIGGLAASYGETGKYVFGLGASIASFCWFFALGYSARFLAPLFARPKSWQVLDSLIALTMWGIAVSLVLK